MVNPRSPFPLRVAKTPGMEEGEIARITSWIMKQGLAGVSEKDLLYGFCEECQAAGVEFSAAVTIIDTLHPIYEGRAFFWRADGLEEEPELQYESTSEGEGAERWKESAFFHLLQRGESELRRRFCQGDPADFRSLEEIKEAGATDCLAMVHRFDSERVIGEMDCFYSNWTTNHPEGFTDAEVGALRRLVPALGLATKCASLTRIAGTLVEVYLGRDAGRRVLEGRISRGVTERINAVLWFSDLRGYTTITDAAPPDEIIPLLNDYAEVVISAIHEAGGDVLKLVGDGTLAIFNATDSAEACRCALQAEANLRNKLAELNKRRAEEKRPLTTVYIGLHIGDVFYGNIGSDERLDFTVVGPAVNEVSRIVAMCRSVDRNIVMSSNFAAATPEPERSKLVSVGRYALRGVGRAQELFTIDPALCSDEKL